MLKYLSFNNNNEALFVKKYYYLLYTTAIQFSYLKTKIEEKNNVV